MGNYENFYGRNTWVEKYELTDKDIWDKYITCLYFTFISMITVGYGDITPVSTNERIYVIFQTIISCGVFGYSVNKIS